jgi:ATP-dependent DNA ligase
MYLYPCQPNELSINSPFFEKLEKDTTVIAEVKKNGWRCLVEKENGVITLWTRHHTVFKDAVPGVRADLAEMLKDYDNLLLDGEIIEKRTKNVKDQLYLFDIIIAPGNDPIYRKPLWYRRNELEQIVGDREWLHVELASQYHIGKRNLYWQSINDDLHEGIVLKDINKPYPISRIHKTINPSWIKCKKAK